MSQQLPHRQSFLPTRTSAHAEATDSGQRQTIVPLSTLTSSSKYCFSHPRGASGTTASRCVSLISLLLPPSSRICSRIWCPAGLMCVCLLPRPAPPYVSASCICYYSCAVFFSPLPDHHECIRAREAWLPACVADTSEEHGGEGRRQAEASPCTQIRGR